MSILSYCRRPACTASADETLQSAAQRMEKEGIGLLAVTEGEHLAGVLTDRDVALQMVAGGRDASRTRVGDVMTRPPITVGPRDSLEDALARMARAHVRRLLVVDGEQVEGVVSADDLVLLLARELGGLGEVLVAQLPAGATRSFVSEAGEADRAAATSSPTVATW
jgi:CBS domain-containing protein